MKRPDHRPVRPVKSYLEHQRYPAVEQDERPEDEDLDLTGEVSRREFLGRAAVSAGLAGAAGVGLTGLAAEGQAAPRDKDTRKQVSIHLGRQRLGNSTMSVRRVMVWTADKKLARWAGSYRNRSSLTRAFGSILRKATEKVLVDGKKLYQLERKLGAALVRHYKKKTGKRVKQPDLMIILGRYWRPRLRGRIRRPIFRPRPRLRP